MYLHREDYAWFIWWYGEETSWAISRELGVIGTEWWRREGIQPLGLFSPMGDATGNAMVSTGPH